MTLALTSILTTGVATKAHADPEVSFTAMGLCTIIDLAFLDGAISEVFFASEAMELQQDIATLDNTGIFTENLSARINQLVNAQDGLTDEEALTALDFASQEALK